MKYEYVNKTVYEERPDHKESAVAYCDGYKAFLDAAKTEREAVTEAIRLAKAAGFSAYELGDKLSVGDKRYLNNRGKNLFLFTVGEEPLEKGIRIAASHIDSPRLDVKQQPLYEDGGIAFFKTHYYGGIRKYQWVTVPLSLHGVIVRADGTELTVNVGEAEDDPIFYITDLLPHLGHKQGQAPLDEAIEAEKLNVAVGGFPLDGEEKDAIKANVLTLLHDAYGITEEDFLSAELCLVPAMKARDIGFDRALIGAYGHDDRVCAYPSLTALFDVADKTHTDLVVLADKEEIGSEGVSGMQCDLLTDLIDAISRAKNADPAVVRAHSVCLSADVSAAFDPDFAEVFEKKNAAFVSRGTVLTKYTGARGKSSTNDASAEYIGRLRRAFSAGEVVWQAAELGKTDVGGGGTVAKYIAKHNVETVDLGVAVLSMHAPYEAVAKADVYETHRAVAAFFAMN